MYPTMNYFGHKLTELLDSNGLSQMDLARKISMTGSQISRYSRGESEPEIDSLGKIVEQFDRKDRAQLLVAYLRNRIPQAVHHLVDIDVKSTTVTVAIESDLPKSESLQEFRDAINYLLNNSSASKTTREAIIALVQALNWKP